MIEIFTSTYRASKNIAHHYFVYNAVYDDGSRHVVVTAILADD